MSLFKKRIKEIVLNDALESGEIFYIPKSETIQAIKNRQPLSENQIEDYINYIKKNYFVSVSHKNKMFQFCGEFTLNASDMKSYTSNVNEAYNNVRQCLLEGDNPSVIDALWLSDNVYVDDENVDLRVNITKEPNGNGMCLNIVNAKKNAEVYQKVSQLKAALKKAVVNKISDEVAKKI